jgi:C1A family cysteine protease
MRVVISTVLVAAATPDYQQMWGDFKQAYNKVYNGDEEQQRFGVFKQNVDIIEAENAKELSYKLGVNGFADLTAEEFAARYLGGVPPQEERHDGAAYLGEHEVSGEALPTSVDWSTQGAVTPIKNQGQCGSCWSFSTTGALEGAQSIATGQLLSISEQQLVDCSGSYGNQGCNGGWPYDAFKYAEANAMCSEASYAYTATDGTCHASGCSVALPQGTVTGYKSVSGGESGMMSAVAQNPVSITVEADQSVFQLYSSGVLTSSACGTNIDHAVLAVGYGTLNGVDYWKVKNSWGASWGQNGYILLGRGIGGAGECGIYSYAPTYPVVSGSTNVVV